jgi:ABC-type branched-subunit amino acid transport system ATPase component
MTRPDSSEAPAEERLVPPPSGPLNAAVAPPTGVHTGDSILRTEGLLKQFAGVAAVNYLSLALPRTGITSIVGPNGSGKSTLINVLSGVLPIDEGMVVIDGVSLRAITPSDSPTHGVTRTFQEVRLFNQMTVWDNILVTLTNRTVLGSLLEFTPGKYEARARELLETVGLWEKRRDLAVNLSYGQRKLLEVARALAMDVKIYLFDEPFAGLFPAMLERVKVLLTDLKARGKAIIFIEHNMDLIRALSDYLFVLDSGELLAEGEVNEVLSRPEVIEAYLGT